MAKKRATTRRWVRHVTTDATHPPAGTFNQSAAEIARTMARKRGVAEGAGVRTLLDRHRIDGDHDGVRVGQFADQVGNSADPIVALGAS